MFLLDRFQVSRLKRIIHDLRKILQGTEKFSYLETEKKRTSLLKG